MEITAAEFKAKCLQLMDRVRTSHESITVTKRGRPVARLMPLEDAPVPALFGCLKGTVTEHADITMPIDVEWDAEHGRDLAA